MYVYILCSPVFSPAIRGIEFWVGDVVTVKVSIVVSDAGVEPSVVPVGPASVKVQKSSLIVQISTKWM